MTASIFGSLAPSRTPTREDPRGYGVPDPSAPPSLAAALPAPSLSLAVGRSAQRAPARTGSSPGCHDATLIAVIEAPLVTGETARDGFARKEAELRAAFAALSVLESRGLYARLSNPRTGDLLPAAFARLTADRRARLIDFLADARRREALSTARY